MAQVENPRKNFQFNIILPGLDPFLCQDVKTPDADIDVVQHGDAGFMVKTGGMKKIGNLTISKISPADSVDAYFKNWQGQIMSTRTGGGALPSQYKTTIMVEELSTDGFTVINREVYKGCWPSKINGKDLSRKASENTVESVELQVDQDD